MMNKLLNFIKKNAKYSKYLLYFGLTLLIAGILAALISGNWSEGYLILILLGVISIIFSGINVLEGFLSKRGNQALTNGLIKTITVLIIIALINILATKYSYRLDLTENQILSLSPQTMEIVKNLPQKLKVWVFTREKDPFDQELLENYRRYGSNFSFEFVDPQVNIALAQKFKLQNPGEVYLEYGDKKQLITTLKQGEFLTEITLTNAIETIQKEQSTFIYFLQGHGELSLNNSERGLSQIVDKLKAKGNTVETLNFATNKTIPDNTNLLIIPGPKKPLFPQEIDSIKTYLNSGKSLMILLDPEVKSGLESFLKEFSITLDQRLLIDGSGAGDFLGLGPATVVITEYGDHPITKDFGNNMTIFPLARHFEFSPSLGLEVTPLLITNQQTWAESDLNGQEVTFDQGVDLPSPLTVGLALNNQEKKSRLIMIGNSEFISNAWINQQFNTDLFLNSVNWLIKNDDSTLSISPKEPKNRRINLSKIKSIILTLLSLLIMPLIALIIAAFTWWKRR